MTPQEIYTKVANHLLKQNTRCTGEDGCLYRGPNNLKCAAGCLIPDDVYQPQFEGKAIDDVMSISESVRQIIGEENTRLVLILQRLHDTIPPSEWPAALKGVALSFNLDAIDVVWTV